MPAKSLTLNVPMLAMGKARPRVCRGRAFMPEPYRKWKINFCRHAKMQALSDAFTGNYRLDVEIWTTTSRCPSDADNVLGSVNDALQDCGIVTNDKKNRSGSYCLKDYQSLSNYMIVTITELPPDHYPVKTTKKKAKK